MANESYNLSDEVLDRPLNFGRRGEPFYRSRILPSGEIQSGNGLSPPVPRLGIHQRGIYVPAGWGEFWNAARTGGSPRVACVGDSITRGFFASDISGDVTSTSWVGRLRAALQAAHGDGGSGWQGVADTSIFTNFPAAYESKRIQITGPSWAALSNFGVSARALYPPTTATVPHTMTAKVRGSIVEVWYVSHPTYGTINWTIDGVAQPDIVAAAAADILKARVEGLSNTEHTVVLTLAAGQMVPIQGFMGKNPTGARVDNYGVGSSNATLLLSPQTAATWPAEWTGGKKNPADLLVYGWGVNDANTSRPAADYINDIRTYLNSVRSGAPNFGATDIVFLVPHVGTLEGATKQYHNYTAQLRGLAEAYGAALIDSWTIGRNSWDYANSIGWWGRSDATGGAGSDPVHPSNEGFRLMYEALASVVL